METIKLFFLNYVFAILAKIVKQLFLLDYIILRKIDGLIISGMTPRRKLYLHNSYVNLEHKNCILLTDCYFNDSFNNN